jgi:general secretion pathway protein F
VARFAFEAVDRAGVVVRGHIEAQGRPVAVEQLLAQGQTPLSLTEARAHARFNLEAMKSLRPGGSELLIVARELSGLLKAGLPIERALGAMQNLNSDRRISLHVGQMLERVRAGEPLSRAMRVILPAGSAHIEHLVAAGEASGHLAAVMARLASNLEHGRILRERVISALTYPAFLVVTMAIVLWIVFTSVLPRLAPLFSQAKSALPLPTRMLLAISNFLQDYGWWVLALIVLCALGAVYALQQPRVRSALDRFALTSRLFLRVPAEYEAARYCRNLETLLAGGLPLDRALAAARSASGNRWFRERALTIQEAVEGGARLRVAFANAKILPPTIVEFAAIGEETGELAAMMRECAELLERDVETRLDRLSALILPIATLAMGLLVAGVMAGVVTGLLAVNDLAG